MATSGSSKLLYLIGTLDHAGTPVHLVELIRRLDPERFQVEVCCLRNAGPLAERVRAHGVPVHELGMPIVYQAGFLPSVFRLIHRIRAGNYDLVHGLLFAADFFGTFAARLGGAGVVVNSRRMMPLDEAPRRRRAYRLANRWVDRIVVPSEAVRRSCLELEGVDPGRVTTVYNGIDPERIRGAPAPVNVPDGTGPWILTAGGINPLKGHDTLVRALPGILRRCPAARLVVAGDGPLRESVVREAERIGVRDSLVLLGTRRDVPSLLGWADLFVQPSDSEGMSNAVLEAMAAGRAVVATGVGGNPEVVEPGLTGLLVPPADPEALATAVGDLLEDPVRREQMGKAGSKRVDRGFTVDRMADRMAAFYAGLLEAERPLAPATCGGDR